MNVSDEDNVQLSGKIKTMLRRTVGSSLKRLSLNLPLTSIPEIRRSMTRAEKMEKKIGDFSDQAVKLDSVD